MKYVQGVKIVMGGENMSKNKEYIEREALRQSINPWLDGTVLVMPVSALDEAPAANVVPVKYAYWDWQCDGTHFCSECGTDALYNYEGKEFCSLRCPHCGAVMTHQEDQI